MKRLFYVAANLLSRFILWFISLDYCHCKRFKIEKKRKHPRFYHFNRHLRTLYIFLYRFSHPAAFYSIDSTRFEKGKINRFRGLYHNFDIFFVSLIGYYECSKFHLSDFHVLIITQIAHRVFCMFVQKQTQKVNIISILAQQKKKRKNPKKKILWNVTT